MKTIAVKNLIYEAKISLDIISSLTDCSQKAFEK